MTVERCETCRPVPRRNMIQLDEEGNCISCGREILDMNMEELKDIIKIDVRCSIPSCLKALAPMDRGVFVKGCAVCEDCAQEIWKTLDNGRTSNLLAIARVSEFEGWDVDAKTNCCITCGGFEEHLKGCLYLII